MSDYTETQWQKIAGEKSVFIDYPAARFIFNAELPAQGRIYGLDSDSGQIVRLHTAEALDNFPRCERIWVSGTTLADIIS